VTPHISGATHHALRQPIFWLVGVFLLLGFIYALTTPLFEASDELWHYPMAQHLSRTFELPVQDPNNVGPWRQEASQPPLYYYLMGWATAWIDTSDMPQARWLNPHVDNGIITLDGNVNLAIHTPAENFPWRGTILAVRLIRLLSVLMGAGTVLFTYLLAREFFADEASRLFAAALVAFTPMFAFISGAVNNDNLASLLSAIILFMLVCFVRNTQYSIPNTQYLLLGILLGLAALTKQSALGLFPLAGLTLLVIAFRRLAETPAPSVSRHSSRFTFYVSRLISLLLLPSSLVFVSALLIPSWWYIRNLVLYGDLLGWSAFIAVLGQRQSPASLAQLWGERESFSRSYWGLFGGVNVPMSDWIYTAFNLIGLVAIASLAVFVITRLIRLVRHWDLGFWKLRFPYALLLGQLAFIVYGLLQWATVTWSSQGRLVFSGLSAIGVLMALGWRTLSPEGVRLPVYGAVATFMAAVSFLAPFLFIAPTYVDPPELTAAQIAAISHPLQVDFGSVNFPPEMRLLGYAVKADQVRPGEAVEVTLYWQSLAAMDRDWSVFVHVVDEAGIVVAQRDTYPGLGLMPTRKWKVGQTLADTYVIALPPATYAPGKANIEIGLYDYATDDRLLIVTLASPDAGRDALTLAPLTISANPGDLPNPQAFNFGNQIRLEGYDLDRRAAAPGETLTLTLYWRGLKQMTTNYSVFAHVRGPGESLWAQNDTWPLDGTAPTALWQAGQQFADVRQLTLKPETAPGVYDIEVGLYDEKGQRLQLVLPDGRLTDHFVYLSKIRVLP
jgi:hypothetical protein